MHGELAAPVVADADQQVQAVAVPLDAHPTGLARVDEREHRAADDRPRRVRDLAGQRSAGRRRLDELHVEVAEPHERPEVAAKSRERADDRLEQRARAARSVAVRSSDERGRGHVDRHGPSRPVVEPRRAQHREHRLERHRVPVGLLGDACARARCSSASRGGGDGSSESRRT